MHIEIIIKMNRVLRSGSVTGSVVVEIPEEENVSVGKGGSVGGSVFDLSDGAINEAKNCVNFPEISEGAMHYLESLLRGHERKLTERFAATE